LLFGPGETHSSPGLSSGLGQFLNLFCGPGFFLPARFSDLVLIGCEFFAPPRDAALPGRTLKGIAKQHSSPIKVLVMKLLNNIKTFLKSEDGPTAVEYAVMLALIVIVCLTAIQAIGTNANVTFNSVASKLGTTGS
jgi:pilus assembly protein Flp/PilA